MIHNNGRLTSCISLSDRTDRANISMGVPLIGGGHPIVTIVQQFEDKPVCVVTIWEDDIHNMAKELRKMRIEATRIGAAQTETKAIC